MKTYIPPALFLVLFFGCTDSEERLTEYNELSFFLTGDTMVTTMLDVKGVQPESTPFIAYNEIVSYDSSSHILKLNRSVESIYITGQVIDRRGFVAMLDETKIYCGIFYSPIHSVPNPNIVITLPCNEIPCDSCLQIIEGYPNDDYYTGNSDINDPRIIELLKRDNKLK